MRLEDCYLLRCEQEKFQFWCRLRCRVNFLCHHDRCVHEWLMQQQRIERRHSSVLTTRVLVGKSFVPFFSYVCQNSVRMTRATCNHWWRELLRRTLHVPLLKDMLWSIKRFTTLSTVSVLKLWVGVWFSGASMRRVGMLSWFSEVSTCLRIWLQWVNQFDRRCRSSSKLWLKKQSLWMSNPPTLESTEEQIINQSFARRVWQKPSFSSRPVPRACVSNLLNI